MVQTIRYCLLKQIDEILLLLSLEHARFTMHLQCSFQY